MAEQPPNPGRHGRHGPPTSTAARLSQTTARRFTLTLYAYEATSLETIRQHIGARSAAETVRRLIVSAAAQIRLDQSRDLFGGRTHGPNQVATQADGPAPTGHDEGAA